MTTTIPTEIWDNACEYACTDDGRTGRSLSLVSKCFEAISRPYKYRSIALRNTQQIKAFSQLLERDAPSMAQPVHYLFFLFSEGEVSQSPFPREHLTSEFYSIIQLIHSHLRSLSIYAPALHLFTTYTPAPIFFFDLTELTIICKNANPFFSLSSHLGASTGAAAALPRLRAARLHLGKSPRSQLFDIVSTSSPALQTLFVNQVKLLDDLGQAQRLRSLLIDARAISLSPAGHAILHPSPMTIVLELIPKPQGAMQLIMWLADKQSYRFTTSMLPMDGLVVIDAKKVLEKHTILRGWNDGNWPSFECPSGDDF